MSTPSLRLLKKLLIENEKHQKYAIGIILIVHFFGILGLLYPPTRTYFEAASPFSLLLTIFLLFYFHHDWNLAFLTFCLITYFLGFTIEVIGVHSQKIFGSYAYGKSLGFKIWDVPLIIGLNWLLLTYCCGSITAHYTKSIFFNSALASGLMVLLDFLIEPVATILDYWRWKSNIIPFQNYVAWFFTAFCLQLLFHALKFNKNNKLSKYVIAVQAFFFIILQIAL